MRKTRHITAFFTSLAIALILSAGTFVGVVTTVGRGYCTEQLVPMMFDFKMECLRRSKAPRFVIMSGSNAQHTIDCEKLAKAIDRDVVCAGLLYVMPVRFYEAVLDDALQPGDVLYLPLENWHYHMPHDELTSPFAVSFLWGVYPKALSTLTPWELSSLYCKKGLSWLQTVLPRRWRGEITKLAPHHMYDLVRKYPGSDIIGGFRLRGDSISNLPSTMDPQSALDMPTQFSDEFRFAFGRLLDMAARRGVRVVLGSVVCYSYPWEQDLPLFERRLQELGLPLCGNPAALCLPYGCFSDFNLHCNAVGRSLFTQEITRDICRVLGKPFAEQIQGPLVLFGAETGNAVRFAQADGCAGSPTFGEFILDRKGQSETNVVARVLVDGEPVRFEEKTYAAKNVLWVWWNRPEKDLSVEIVPREGCACRAERVLMEPNPSGEIAKIVSINDVSSDFVDSGDGHFACKAKNEKEAYLRVRIPNWKSNRHRLHLTLRGDDVLRQAKVGGTSRYRRDLLPDEIGENEIAVRIALNESDAFVQDNGDAVAGVYFPAGALRGGEKIVLERFSFEML